MHVCPCGPLKADKSQKWVLEWFCSVSLCSFLGFFFFFLVPVFSCSDLALRSWNKIFSPVQSLYVCRMCFSVFFFSFAACGVQQRRGLTVFILLRLVKTLSTGKLRHVKVSLPPLPPAGRWGAASCSWSSFPV